MNLYVFTNVLCDYTPGMALIAADDYEQAMGLAASCWKSSAEKSNPYYEEGWDSPTVYPFDSAGVRGPVILHCVYGGG